MGLCNEEKLGKLLLDPRSPPPVHEIQSAYIIGNGVHADLELFDSPIEYAVRNTGYYCIRIYNPRPDVSSVALRYRFENAYGNLPPELRPIQKVAAVTFPFIRSSYS